MIKRYPLYKYLLALLDWIIINAAFVAALKLQTQFRIDIMGGQFPYVAPEVIFLVFFSMIIILIFQYSHLYKINVILNAIDHSLRLLQALFYSILLLSVISFFAKSQLVLDSRKAFIYFILLSTSTMLIVRVMFLRSIFIFLAKRGIYTQAMLIVGAGVTGRLAAANIGLNNPFALNILGFVDDEIDEGTPVIQGLKVIGQIGDIPRLSERMRLDEILVCLEKTSYEALYCVLDICRKAQASIKIASPLYDIIPARIFTERYGDIPVVGVYDTSLKPSPTFVKRIFDVFLATIGMILLSPLLVLAAIAIKVDSPGPILYKQIRIGKDGKAFQLYKFRSMRLGSDQDETRKERLKNFIQGHGDNNRAEDSTKIVDESRITRVGRLIRKTSIDEVPQLLNILKGEMSLVGPRPCLPYEWEHYEEWHKKRLSILPGCTGIWQINGRSEVGFRDMVILDLFYIHNTSIPLDIQILFKTIPVVMFGRGGR